MKRILVIGAGAAGFFGAIRAKELHPENAVVLAEASAQVLRKVRISGGGRCNVTHSCFDPAELVKHYPRGSRELRGIFARFQPRNTVEWFEARGVELKTEDDGRMFPITDDSETIAQCLEETAREVGVELRTSCRIQEIRREDSDFIVSFADGNQEKYSAILLATGSAPAGYAFAKSLGHTIEPLAPSLFTFNIQDTRIHDLSGVSFARVETSLQILTGERFEQSGPLLITHWGMSGPAVLKLSAFAARELQDSKYLAEFYVNFAPGLNPETAVAPLAAMKEEFAKRQVNTQNPFSLPARYWENLLKFLGIAPTKAWSEISKKEIAAIAGEVTRAKFSVIGKGVFKEEFVTAGGVRLSEIDFRTMESKLVPGLFFAGEILDIDGITGGFNFQNAWSTAWIAGSNIGGPAR